MDPEPGEFESSPAGTGSETSGQQCLSNLEMERTIVNGCLLVGVSSNLGGNIFSLEELVIGTQTDSQTPTLSASSKTVFLQISCKPKDNELASKENKQFDPSGKGEGATALKSGCTGIIFFFWVNSELGCPACFLCFCLSVCGVLVLEKSGGHFFLRAEKKWEERRKTRVD